jgi:hypothetical protein
MRKKKPEVRSQKPEGKAGQACWPVLARVGQASWPVFVFAFTLAAQTTTTGPVLRFTATPTNVSGPREPIRIDLFRWSTDAERDRMLSAWTNPAAPRGRGGRGRAGAIDPNDPAFAPDPAGPQGGTGRAGRGGRGGRGGEAPPEAPPTPESSLAAALFNAPTVGYLWSSEVAGYSVRYAVRLPEQNGGERIVLVTDRRLGAWNDLWKPAGSPPATGYEFSVIEMRLNASGVGEGKSSLTGKVGVDSAAKSFVLENYGESSVLLAGVKENKLSAQTGKR